MRLVTQDDLIDTYAKIRQRGIRFIAGKINISNNKRTVSAFDDTEIDASNWWNIPAIKNRWNKLITGNEKELYEDYVIKKYLKDRKGLKMLSLGSGVCNHEIHFASNADFEEVLCVDFAASLLQKGKEKSQDLGLQNMKFSSEDISKLTPSSDYYDVVLFHSSLHHFYNVDKILKDFVSKTLQKGGLLIFHEYVGPNRLQFPQFQLEKINQALKVIPHQYRVRYKTEFVKNRVTGPGIIRMILADPSECVDSVNILPAANKYFECLEEKPLGGNILMPLLKDIAHHFVNENESSNDILQKLFILEDDYLLKHKTDFLFGIYRRI